MRPVVYTATAADVTNGNTPVVVVDYLRVNGQYGLKYVAAGGAAGSGTVQYSLDDPFANTYAQMTWYTVPLLNNAATINQVARAFSVASPVAGDVFTVVPQGGSPGV